MPLSRFLYFLLSAEPPYTASTNEPCPQSH